MKEPVVEREQTKPVRFNLQVKIIVSFEVIEHELSIFAVSC